MATTGPKLTRRFRELEQRLCRIENRTGLLHTDDADRRYQGHHALAGRLLGEAREFLRGIKGLPTQQQIAAQLGVGANQITQWLRGRPAGKRNWCQDCNRLLAWMLQTVID